MNGCSPNDHFTLCSVRSLLIWTHGPPPDDIFVPAGLKPSCFAQLGTFPILQRVGEIVWQSDLPISKVVARHSLGYAPSISLPLTVVGFPAVML